MLTWIGSYTHSPCTSKMVAISALLTRIECAGRCRGVPPAMKTFDVDILFRCTLLCQTATETFIPCIVTTHTNRTFAKAWSN